MKNKRRFVRKSILLYIGVFAVPVIFMLIHMAIKGCYPFGENTILLADCDVQYAPFYKILYDIVTNHKSLMFNLDVGMGLDMYTNYWYYLSNPLNWFVLLFGKNHIELGIICMMLIEVGACGITALYYFRHSKVNKMEKGITNSLFCCICALAYSMCDYIMAYQFNIIWLPCLVLVPLLLLGIEKLVDNQDCRLYMIVLFLAFLFNFYFSFFLCELAVIWFFDQKKESFKKGLIQFFKFAGASIVSAMCAAFVLIPCFIMVSSKTTSVNGFSDLVLDAFGNVGDFFQGFLWGHKANIGGNAMVVNNNYCGLFILVFAVIYCFNGSIDIRQRIKRIAEIVILSFCLNWTLTIYVLHGFSAPVGFNSRFAFILSMILIVTGMEAVQNIEKIRLRFIAVAGVIFAAIVAVILMFNTDVESIACYFISIIVIAYLFICMILLRKKSITKTSFMINVLVIGLLELFTNPFLAISSASKLELERDANTADWADAYEAIEVEESERKTSWMYDSSVVFYYSNTSIFSSSINSNLIYLFKKLGMYYMTNGNSYNYRGTTPLDSTLFNVRYVLSNEYAESAFGGYEVCEEADDYNIYKSDYLAGFGYVLPEEILEWDIDDGSPFKIQNRFSNEVLNDGYLYTQYEVENLEINCFNSVEEYSDGNSCTYLNVSADVSQYPSYMEFSFNVDEAMDLYMYVYDFAKSCYSVYIDDELTYISNRISCGDMIHIGNVTPSQNIKIDVRNYTESGEEGTTVFYFYSYNEDVMQKCLADMRKSQFEVSDYTDTRITGSIEVEDAGVLYLSLPYYKGFKVYIDGNEVETLKVGGAMLGAQIEEGTHEIEIRYFTYGLKPAIIISLVGLLFAVIIFVRCTKGRKEDGEKE